MSAELLLNKNPNLITDSQVHLSLAAVNELIMDTFSQYQKHTNEDLAPKAFTETLLAIEQNFLLLSSFNTAYSPELMQVYAKFYHLNEDLLEVCRTFIKIYPEMYAVLNRAQNLLRALLSYQYYNQAQKSK